MEDNRDKNRVRGESTKGIKKKQWDEGSTNKSQRGRRNFKFTKRRNQRKRSSDRESRQREHNCDNRKTKLQQESRQVFRKSRVYKHSRNTYLTQKSRNKTDRPEN